VWDDAAVTDSESVRAAPDGGPVVLRAHAKLTLSLRVTGVRGDGHHLIDAEMVSLDLADELEVDPGGDALVVARAGAREPGDDHDLVLRALRLADRTAGVVLHKRIPAGAGLGGGSSDAAAILRWAGITDPAVAVAIGADVPFCLVGGRARVQGIGELLTPLPHRELVVTMLTPPVHCSTPSVYRAWDDLGGPHGDHGNDLEPAALHAFPELADWRDELAEQVGERPRLAGSGATWFVEGAHPGPGRVVARAVPGPGESYLPRARR
jgi:4-diphosphocytidyl-2-C-methyl-D-erythritol kinase